MLEEGRWGVFDFLLGWCVASSLVASSSSRSGAEPSGHVCGVSIWTGAGLTAPFSAIPSLQEEDIIYIYIKEP